MANTTRESKTVLTAEDRTTSAFASLQKNVASAADSISRMQGALSGLVAGGIIGGFAAMVKHSLDYADSLNKMAQKTGIATEELSKLSYAAKMSDVSNEALTKGIKGLAQEMTKATDATSLQAALFRQMGVDIRGGLDPALMKIADTFKVLPDGATKAALAVDLFGKAGMDMIPFLNQGSAGIEKLKAEAERLGLVMGGDSAKAAEQFNDNIKALQESSKAFGVAIVNNAAPALAQMTDAVKRAYIEGGKFQAMIEALGQAGRAMRGDYDGVNTQIKKLVDELARLEAMKANMMQGGPLANLLMLFGEDKNVAAKIDEVTAALARLRKVQSDGQLAGDADGAVGAWQENNFRKIKERNDAAKRAAEDMKKWNERLRLEDAKGWVEKIDNDIKEYEDGLKLMAKDTEDFYKERDRLAKLDAKGWIESIEAQEKEYEDGLKAIGGLSKSWHQEQDKLNAEITQNQVNAWDDLANHIVGAFGRGKDAIKDFLRQMLALFAKKWILQIAAGLTGSTALGALASTTGQGSAVGMVGNALGLGGVGSGLGGIIGTAETVSAGGMITQGTGIMGSMGSAGSMLAAAGPYIAIAAALYGLYKAFASPGGGPKTGGSFQGMYDAAGNLTGTNSAHLFGLKPNESTGNATVESLAAATAAAYFKLAGSNAKAINFGFGYDTDPRGTAQDRISVYARDAAGNNLYNVKDLEVGRNGERIGPELQLAASRALLAAWQSSITETEMAKLLGSVVAATADQATLDALAASAYDLQAVLTALATTTIPGLTLDALKGLQTAGESLSATFMRITGEWTAARGALNAAIGARNPQFARDLALSQRNEIAQAFANALGQNFGDELLERMALKPETFTGLNTETMNLLANFLGLQTTLEGLDRDLGTLGGTVQDLGNYVLNAGEIIGQGSGYIPPDMLGGARASLADQLRGAPLGDLSPLTLKQKYDYSKTELDRLIGLAPGNEGAMSQVYGAYQNFLGFSRQKNASGGQFNTDFFGYFDKVNQLTGNVVARPASGGDIQTMQAAFVAEIKTSREVAQVTNQAIAAMANAVVENMREGTAETKAQLVEANANLQKIASRGGALSSNENF